MVRVITLFICLISLCTSAWAATLTATVDRTQLSQEEHLVFTLSLINSDVRLRAEGVDPNVDLSVLNKDFSLGRPEASNSYNIYQGRGRSTSEIRVNLFPRHAGRLTIPVFEIDGVKTTAINIDVKRLATSAAPEIFVRSGSMQKELWIGQQLVVYLDVFHRIALEKASLGDNIETEPMRIELLQHWKLDQDKRIEKYEGYDYEVERIAWAIFPADSGKLTVYLPDVWLTTQTGRQQRLDHQALEFNVKPLPKGVPADIIIGKPTLTQTLPPQQVKQHDLNQWTVSLAAPVAVTSLPDLLPGVKLPDTFKLYLDPARREVSRTASGIIDRADYTIAFIATEAGNFETQPIRVPYFDPKNATVNLLEVPGQKISVSKTSLPLPTSDILIREPGQAKQHVNGTLEFGVWQSMTFILALLWLITLVLWRRSNRQPLPNKETSSAPATKQVDQRHPLQQQLLAVMGSKTLEDGLTRWLELNPEDTVVLNAVRNVQRFCYGKSTLNQDEIQEQINEAMKVLRNSSVHRENKSSDPWQPEAFTPSGKITKQL